MRTCKVVEAIAKKRKSDIIRVTKACLNGKALSQLTT